MVAANNGVPLCVEEHGSGSGARFEVAQNPLGRHGEVIYVSRPYGALVGGSAGGDGDGPAPGELAGRGHGGHINSVAGRGMCRAVQ